VTRRVPPSGGSYWALARRRARDATATVTMRPEQVAAKRLRDDAERDRLAQKYTTPAFTWRDDDEGSDDLGGPEPKGAS
jgi:hypothetical protein